jgi:hypothetical protein
LLYLLNVAALQDVFQQVFLAWGEGDRLAGLSSCEPGVMVMAPSRFRFPGVVGWIDMAGLRLWAGEVAFILDTNHGYVSQGEFGKAAGCVLQQNNTVAVSQESWLSAEL